MRISIVGPTFPYKGGTALHTTEMAHRLQRSGNTVEIQTWKRQYPNFLYPGMQYLDRPEYPEFPAVVRALSWNRPDSWHRVGRACGRSEATIMAVVKREQMVAYSVIANAARRAGSRIVAVAHNVIPHEQRRSDRMLAKPFYRLVDAVLVHSEHEAATARALGCREVIVRPLPFHFDGGARAEPAAETAVTHRRLAFFGFVRPHKGLDVLIEALARSATRPQLEVLGEFWESAEPYGRLAARLGVADLLTIVPGYAPTDALVDLLARSDALVVPYKHATGTQVPRVARHLGVPSLVTDVADLATQTRDGVDGFVVPPNDPDALAAAIDRIYQPGVLGQLRASVRPVDTASEWAHYLDGLEQALRPPAERLTAPS